MPILILVATDTSVHYVGASLVMTVKVITKSLYVQFWIFIEHAVYFKYFYRAITTFSQSVTSNID